MLDSCSRERGRVTSWGRGLLKCSSGTSYFSSAPLKTLGFGEVFQKSEVATSQLQGRQPRSATEVSGGGYRAIARYSVVVRTANRKCSKKFSGEQVNFLPSLLMCRWHFTDSSFLNKPQFDRFVKRLILILRLNTSVSEGSRNQHRSYASFLLIEYFTGVQQHTLRPWNEHNRPY